MMRKLSLLSVLLALLVAKVSCDSDGDGTESGSSSALKDSLYKKGKRGCCTVSGDPHYFTPDGQVIHFQGVCTYVLSRRADHFEVVAENEYRYGRTHVSYTKAIHVIYKGKTYSLKKKHIFELDGVVTSYPYEEGEVKVRREKWNLVVYLRKEKIYVLFNGNHRGVVCVDNRHKDKVEGICGNYDGKKDNDLTTKTGTEVNDNRQGHRTLGDSWKTDDSCQIPTSLGPTCTAALRNIAAQNDKCGLLKNSNGPFRNCHGEVDVDDFYEACVYDICATYPDEEAMQDVLCDAYQNYYEYCEGEEEVYDFWSGTGCKGPTDDYPEEPEEPIPPRDDDDVITDAYSGVCCTASGDPHYTTLDGERIHFQGVCIYNLLSALSGLFSVHVENEFRNGKTHVSYTKSVIIQYGTKTYHLKKHHYLEVNGFHQAMPYSDDSDVEIRRNNVNTIVKLGNTGVTILWNGRHRVVVCLPEDQGYQNAVNGICGNFDGDKNNDRRTKDGVQVNRNRAGWKAIGDSYNVNAECSVVSPEGPECTDDDMRQAALQERCGQIVDEEGPFRQCIENGMDFEEFYNTCEYDVCATYPEDIEAMRETVCENLQDFDEKCRGLGFQVDDWWTEAGCEGDTLQPKDTSGYGPWGFWGPCSVDCGTVGVEERSRVCEEPPCDGDATQQRHCSKTNVPCEPDVDCTNILDHPSFTMFSDVDIRRNGETEPCRGILITNVIVLTVSECVPASTQTDDVTVVFQDNSEKPATDLIPSFGVTLISLETGAFPVNPNPNPNPNPGPEDNGSTQNPNLTKPIRLPQLTFGDYHMLGGMCIFPDRHTSAIVTIADNNLCGMDQDEPHYMCMTSSSDLSHSNVVGEAVLVEKDNNKVLVVGIIAQLISPYLVKVLDLEHVYDEIGCESKVHGSWTQYYDNDDPNNGMDNEHWTTYPTAICGTGYPVCIEYEVDRPASEIFTNVRDDCPSDQVVETKVRNGFICDNSDQPAGCFCHDYKIRAKCTYHV